MKYLETIADGIDKAAPSASYVLVIQRPDDDNVAILHTFDSVDDAIDCIADLAARIGHSADN